VRIRHLVKWARTQASAPRFDASTWCDLTGGIDGFKVNRASTADEREA
jgi:hypothetical protein